MVVLHIELFVVCILNKKCGCKKQTALIVNELTLKLIWSSLIVFQIKCKGELLYAKCTGSEYGALKFVLL